jgi:hypothetical protein
MEINVSNKAMSLCSDILLEGINHDISLFMKKFSISLSLCFLYLSLLIQFPSTQILKGQIMRDEGHYQNALYFFPVVHK